MKRRKFITVTTEQDFESVYKWMDRRERDVLPEVEDGAPGDDDERSLVLQARSDAFDDGW